MGFINFITRHKDREEIEQLSKRLEKEKIDNCAAQKSMCGELYKFVGCMTSLAKIEPVYLLPDIRVIKNDKRC